MGFVNGRVLRVVLRATAGSDQQVNTFHYDLDDTAGVENDPQALADTFRDDVRPGWAAFYNNAWTIDPVYVVEEIDPLNPLNPRSSWTSGAPITGTATPSSDLLPPQCAVLVKLSTAHIGRRFRGRTWLGGSRSEGEQASGSWSSTFVTGCGTFMGTIPVQPDISPPLSSSTAKWSVYSRTQRAQNLNPYLSEVTGTTVRTLVHTIRSRALYR